MSQGHASERFQKLIAFDKCRLHKVLQTAQYSIVYALVGGVLGTLVDFVFPAYDEELDDTKIFLDAVLQVIVVGIVIFYARKIGKVVPYIFGDEDFCPYKKDYAAQEYQGDIILFLTMVATQTNMLKKFKHLQLSLRQKLLPSEKEEKDETITPPQAGEQKEPRVPPVSQEPNMTGAAGHRYPSTVTTPSHSVNQPERTTSITVPQAPLPPAISTQQPSQNTSSYYTQNMSNPSSTIPFQSQINMDSQLGGDQPPSDLFGSGFEPMVSGNMAYSSFTSNENMGFPTEALSTGMNQY